MGDDLQREWLAFWRACFPEGAGPAAENQRAEMRRAFMAGAWIALGAVPPPGDAGRWEAFRGEAERALESMIGPPDG